jgi:hypothetical protein
MYERRAIELIHIFAGHLRSAASYNFIYAVCASSIMLESAHFLFSAASERHGANSTFAPNWDAKAVTVSNTLILMTPQLH